MPLHDYEDVPQCEANKKDGTRCNNLAMRYSKYCYRHITLLDRMNIPEIGSDDKSLFESIYGAITDENRLNALIAARKRQEQSKDLDDIRALLYAKILEIESSDTSPNYKARDIVHIAEIIRRIAETKDRAQQGKGNLKLDLSSFWKDSRFRSISKKKGPIPIEV